MYTKKEQKIAAAMEQQHTKYLKTIASGSPSEYGDYTINTRYGAAIVRADRTEVFMKFIDPDRNLWKAVTSSPSGKSNFTFAYSVPLDESLAYLQSNLERLLA